MRRLTQTELDVILDENEKWLESKDKVYEQTKMSSDAVNLQAAESDERYKEQAKKHQLVGVELKALENLDLSGLTLAERNLRDAKILNVNLSGANLKETCLALARTEWRDVNLQKADLTRALLHDVKMEDVDFSEAVLNEAEIHGLNGNNLTFDNARMSNIGFAKAFVKNSSFDRASLTQSNLRRTVFIECSFKHCDLQKADLSFAKITRADFRFADFTGANCSAVKADVVRVFGAKGLEYLHQAIDKQIERYDVSKDGDGSRLLDSFEMTFYLAEPKTFDERSFRANQKEVFSDEAAAKAARRVRDFFSIKAETGDT